VFTLTVSCVIECRNDVIIQHSVHVIFSNCKT